MDTFDDDNDEQQQQQQQLKQQQQPLSLLVIYILFYAIYTPYFLLFRLNVISPIFFRVVFHDILTLLYFVYFIF